MYLPSYANQMSNPQRLVLSASIVVLAACAESCCCMLHLWLLQIPRAMSGEGVRACSCSVMTT